jgi:hypothetical protein
MPNEFVGAEQQVRGLNNASWGTVAVIIRNGVPDRVVTPGSRFGRGWRAPLMGAVTLVPIQTDTVRSASRSLTCLPPRAIRSD